MNILLVDKRVQAYEKIVAAIVILAEPRTMRVNNLVCETLLPGNPIAKLYGVNSKYTEYTRDIILSLLKMHTASNNREAYRKVISSL